MVDDKMYTIQPEVSCELDCKYQWNDDGTLGALVPSLKEKERVEGTYVPITTYCYSYRDADGNTLDDETDTHVSTVIGRQLGREFVVQAKAINPRCFSSLCKGQWTLVGGTLKDASRATQGIANKLAEDATSSGSRA
jgi:hypothetical protein